MPKLPSFPIFLWLAKTQHARRAWWGRHEDKIWFVKALALPVLIAAVFLVISWNVLQELQTVKVQRDIAELKLLEYRAHDLSARLNEAEGVALAAPKAERCVKPVKPSKRRKRK